GLSQYSYNVFSFFFSSRRRHTRSKRDWSSDVCSSDLFRGANGKTVQVIGLAGEQSGDLRENTYLVLYIQGYPAFLHSIAHAIPRSEERRVGKECRSRWLMSQE